MRWIGKILGGLVGLWLAGPIGLIIGVFFGHIADMGLFKQVAQHQRYQSFRQGAGSKDLFFQSVFRLMGYLAKSDGQVTPAEIKVAEQVMDGMKLNRELRQRAIDLFNEGKAGDFQPVPILKKLRQHYAAQPNVLRMCHDVLQKIARADGLPIHPNKTATLNQMAQALGMAPFGFDFNDFINRFNQRSGGYSNGHQGQTGGQRAGFNQQQGGNPYTVLGIKREASNAEIKKAYRRLMSQNHPDKLVSKNLSKEEMAKATEKVQTIKSAYETLKCERQF